MVRKARKRKIALIFHDGNWDRVYYGLSVAVAALASDNDVHAMFTFGALKRLRRGRADELGDETSGEIHTLVKMGPARGKLPAIAEMLKDATALGIKLYACPAAMAFFDIKKEDLIPGVDCMTGLIGFLEMSQGASLSFYV